ncbi:MAG: ABC transporter permease, partial [SAR324 cluster bacterium]|nr:ABC transporter permease [SAR324 cluster bacterium]
MAQALSVTDVAFAFLLVAIVGIIQWRTGGRYWTTLHASVRMVVQLLAVGFVLVYIFEAGNTWVNLLVVVVMLTVAGYIAMRPVQDRSLQHYGLLLLSLIAGGLLS